MEFMANEGVISLLPLIRPNKALKQGTPIRFWEQETDYQIRGNIPNIEGHISVTYEGIIQTDKQMVGEHIFCQPIPLPKNDGLSTPAIGYDSMDSTKRASVVFTEYYTDRGLAVVPNDHCSVGTVVYWGDKDLARHNFTPSFGLWNEPGFLIKKEYVTYIKTI